MCQSPTLPLFACVFVSTGGSIEPGALLYGSEGDISLFSKLWCRTRGSRASGCEHIQICHIMDSSSIFCWDGPLLRTAAELFGYLTCGLNRNDAAFIACPDFFEYPNKPGLFHSGFIKVICYPFYSPWACTCWPVVAFAHFALCVSLSRVWMWACDWRATTTDLKVALWLNG